MSRWLPGYGLVETPCTDLTEDQIEHLAACAADRGDVDLELLCDRAIAGEAAALADLIVEVCNSEELQDALRAELTERRTKPYSVTTTEAA